MEKYIIYACEKSATGTITTTELSTQVTVDSVSAWQSFRKEFNLSPLLDKRCVFYKMSNVSEALNRLPMCFFVDDTMALK